MKTEGVHKQTCLARNAKRVLQAEMKRCQLVTQKHIEVHKCSGKGENQNEKTVTLRQNGLLTTYSMKFI